MKSRQEGRSHSELLTVGQVADQLNVHPNTVRRWDVLGLLHALRVGPRGDRRFFRSEVEHLFQSEDKRAGQSSPLTSGSDNR